MNKIVGTKLYGLNVSGDSKDLLTNELSDIKNMRIVNYGSHISLERRFGLRLSNQSSFIDNTTIGSEKIFDDTSRIKYLQVATQAKSLINVFAVRNRVYLYDETLNKFTLLYEAPGEDEVDIADYLGLILVTSHSSNLAILKQYPRHVFMVNRNSRFIKAIGGITGKIVNFETDDEVLDANIKDISTDQSSVYSISAENLGTLVTGVSPSGAEIDNPSFGGLNKYRKPFSVFVGYDEISEAALSGLSGVQISNPVFPTQDYNDFPNGTKTFSFRARRRVQVTATVGSGNNCAIKGLIQDGSNLTEGVIRRGDGNTVNLKQGVNVISEMAGDAYLWFYDTQLKVVDCSFVGFFDVLGVPAHQGTVWHVDSILWSGQGNLLHQNGYDLKIIERDGTKHSWEVNKTFSGNKKRILIGATNINEAGIIIVRPGNFSPPGIGGPGDDNADGWADDRAITPNGLKGRAAGGMNAFRILYKSPSNIIDYRARAVPNFNTTTSKQFVVNLDAGPDIISTGVALKLDKIFGASEIQADITFDDFSKSIDNLTAFLVYENLISQYVNADSAGDQTGSLALRAFKPYYRVESIITGQSTKNYIVDGDGVIVFNKTVVNYLNTVIEKRNIDFSFDFSFGHNDLETEYVVTPGGTNTYRNKIKKYLKDNLDIHEIFLEDYSTGVTDLRVSKINELIFLVKDTYGNYLLAARRISNKVEIFSQYDLSNLGTPLDLKTIIDHNGKHYSLLRSTTGLHLFFVEHSAINLISSYTGLYASAIKDFTHFATGNHTDIYCIQNNQATTFIARLIDDSGFLAFEEDPIVSPIDYRINTPSDYPSLVAFMDDDHGVNSIVMDDTAGTPNDVNRYLEFKFNGSFNGNLFDKILSDQGLSNVLQIRPQTTPFEPIIATAAGAYDRTGRFIYYWLVREFNSSGEVIYESYPSDPSTIEVVTNETVSLDLDENYLASSPTPDSVKIVVFRLELRTTDERMKITDFIELDSVALAETSPGSGLYDLAAPWEDHFVSDTISFAPGPSDSIDSSENYRGYSTSYPRCKFVTTSGNVAFIANDRKYRNNVYYSDVFDITKWQPQQVLSSQLFSNDEVSGLLVNNGVYVTTRDSVEFISGSGLNISKQLITNEVGLVDPRTVQIIDDSLIFVTKNGAHIFRGYNYSKVDFPVDKITSGFVFASALVSFQDPYQKEYRIVYDKNKILAYNIPLKTWFIFIYPYDLILYAFNRQNPITDLPELCLIVKNDEPNVGKVYRMLSEDKYTVYDYVSGSGSDSQTSEITAYVVTKDFDMENPFSEKMWRRIHLETTRSHEVEGWISINNGVFTPMVEQRKRTYFNEVPLVWHRFDQIFGDRIADYGRRGFVSTMIGDFLNNEDGKIDRTALFENGAYANLGDVPALSAITILFWFKQIQTSIEKPIIFSDNSQPSVAELIEDDRAYLNSDFPSPMADFGGLNGPIEGVFYGGQITDSLGNPIVDSFGNRVVLPLGEPIVDSFGQYIVDSFGDLIVDSSDGPIGETMIESTAHGLDPNGINMITIRGLDPAFDGDHEIIQIPGPDNFIIDVEEIDVPAAGRWATPGDFNDYAMGVSDADEIRVKCGAYSWKSSGPISDLVADLRGFDGEVAGTQDWWSDSVNVNPSAGSVTLEVPTGTWDNFSDLANGMKQMRLPNLGIGSMMVGPSFSVG